MEIRSNIGEDTSSIHNNLEYDPIEVQLFKHLQINITDQVRYKVEYKSKYFYSDHFKIELKESSKAKLEISFSIHDKANNYVRMGGHNYMVNKFTTNISYNKDEFKKFKHFCDKVNEMSLLYKKAKELQNEFDNIRTKTNLDKINLYLNEQIKINGFECIAHELGNIFHERSGFDFYIKPIGMAPADGEIFIIQTDKQPIEQFWLNDYHRRDLFRKVVYSNDIEGAKLRLKDLEDFEKIKVDFKAEGCPELAATLEFMKKGYDIFKEIEVRSNKK